MMLNKNIIYLIGFMGSGKSTAGKKLASLLGWSFVDLDTSFENHSGMSIAEFFAKNGEQHFRLIESELLLSLKNSTKTIISTGGGTPCHSENMDYMLETGLCIYLKLTPGQLKSRLSDSSGKRPLIKDIETDRLEDFIEKKLNYREKWYSLADIIVPGFNLDTDSLLLLLERNKNI
jgi:shikimate kinase